MGAHQNRLDAKGRVSVPASFRALLRPGAEEGATALVLRRSHKFPCIEGWPPAGFSALMASVKRLAPFSDAHDDMSMAIYSDAYPMETDKEGRVMIPDELVRHAGLSGQVLFVGTGETFQMWEPEAGQRRREAARTAVRPRELTPLGAAS